MTDVERTSRVGAFLKWIMENPQHRFTTLEAEVTDEFENGFVFVKVYRVWWVGLFGGKKRIMRREIYSSLEDADGIGENSLKIKLPNVSDSNGC